MKSILAAGNHFDVLPADFVSDDFSVDELMQLYNLTNPDSAAQIELDKIIDNRLRALD